VLEGMWCLRGGSQAHPFSGMDKRNFSACK
jgi:hypothetical protein